MLITSGSKWIKEAVREGNNLLSGHCGHYGNLAKAHLQVPWNDYVLKMWDGVSKKAKQVEQKHRAVPLQTILKPQTLQRGGWHWWLQGFKMCSFSAILLQVSQ